MDVTTYAVVGKPVTREDGPEKVSGKTCYSGDLRLPGMLWGKVRVVYSRGRYTACEAHNTLFS